MDWRHEERRLPWRGGGVADDGGEGGEGDEGGGGGVLPWLPLLHLRGGAAGAAVLGRSAGVGRHGVAVVGSAGGGVGEDTAHVRRRRVPAVIVLRAVQRQAVADGVHVRRRAAVHAYVPAPRQGVRRGDAPAGRRWRRRGAARARRGEGDAAPAVRERGGRVPGDGGDAPVRRVRDAVRERRRVLPHVPRLQRRRPPGPHHHLPRRGDARAVRRGRHRLLGGRGDRHRGLQPRRGGVRHGAPRGPRRGAQGVRRHPRPRAHRAGARAPDQPRHGRRGGAVPAPRRVAGATPPPRQRRRRQEARGGRRRRGVLHRVHPRALRRARDHRELHVLPELQEKRGRRAQRARARGEG